MMRLVFLWDTLHIQTMSHLFVDRDVRVICLTESVAEQLKDRNVQSRSLSHYSLVDLEKKALLWLKVWAETKKLDGTKNVKDIFTHDGMSTWWLAENWLYYSHAFYFSVKDVVRSVETLLSILTKEKPQSVFFALDGSLWSSSLEAVCKERGILFEVYGSSSLRLRTNVAQRFRISLISLFFFVSGFLRRFFWFFLRLLYPDQVEAAPSKKRVLVFAGLIERVWVHNWRTHGFEMSEPYTDNVIRSLLEKDFDVVRVEITAGRIHEFPILREKVNHLLVGHRLLDQGMSPRVWWRVARSFVRHYRQYRHLRSDSSFLESFDYRGINLWPLLSAQYDYFFGFRLYFYLREYELVRYWVETVQPDAAYIPIETSEVAKSLFHVCHERGIPTIAVQHGGISYHPNTVHRAEEISPSAQTRSPYCPTATVTCMYGKYYRDFLVQYGLYPSDTVAVTGNPRDDKYRGISFARHDVCKRLGIDPKKQVVLFISSTMPKQDFSSLLDIVYGAVQRFKNVHLIVKMHPSEKSRLPHQAMIAKFGLSSTTIVWREALDQCIAISDVVVGPSSTSGFEAIIFGKPLIVVDVTAGVGVFPFVKEGVAVGATTKDELVSSLTQLLSSKKSRESLATHYPKFISHYSYKIDGNSSERVAKIIVDEAKKKSLQPTP